MTDTAKQRDRAYALHQKARAGALAARHEQDVLDVAIAAVSQRAIVLLPKLRLDKEVARAFVDGFVAQRKKAAERELQFQHESDEQYAEYKRLA